MKLYMFESDHECQINFLFSGRSMTKIVIVLNLAMRTLILSNSAVTLLSLRYW